MWHESRRLFVVLVVVAAISMLGGAAEGGFNDVVEYDSQWGAYGPGLFQLDTPYDIAVDDIGYAYVADSGNDRIKKYTLDGQFLSNWTNGFSSPRGVAVDGVGNVYVADTGNDTIVKLTSSGTYLLSWGGNGVGDGEFLEPVGVAVDGAGNVYVTDRSYERVQRFTSDGQYVGEWGWPGTGDGAFSNPEGVAVDAAGDVYVVDSGNDRVQKFTPDGAFVTKWGSSGLDNGEFYEHPRGVAVDRAGNVYVTDGYRVQKFTSDGVFITTWGSPGSEDGQFSGALGVGVDGAGNVYVADGWNHRIQKFRQRLATVQPVGIGIANPATDLHVNGSDGETQLLVTERSGSPEARTLLTLENTGPTRLRLSDTQNGEAWDLTGGESFSIGDGSTTPFLIETGASTESLVLTGNGVGVGTDDPATSLHVVDANATGLVQEVFRLASNVPPQQLFENTTTGAEWFFAMTSDDEFKISRNGTGAVEAKFFENGNLNVRGDLSAKSFIATSDAAAKTGFTPVNTEAVLQAVADLEVGTWAFQTDPQTRHMGPTAQDFTAAFGLGNTPTGIASVDADGVALAAIQALAEDNQALKSELALHRIGLLLLLSLGGAGLITLEYTRLTRRLS